MSGYIGASPVPQATQHREAFTATASQTSFPTAGYTPQFVDVYLNGVKLAAADYTATNGSDIVLTTGAALDDILEIVAYTPFEVASQTFTGTTTIDVLSVTGAATGTDLTLSGGLYVGGAVAANYLDDYEEGTLSGVVLTPNTGTITTRSGYGTLSYTKVGRTVNLQGMIGVGSVSSPTGSVSFPLPFAAASLSEASEWSVGSAIWTDDGTGTSTGYPILLTSGSTASVKMDASVLAGFDFLTLNISYSAA